MRYGMFFITADHFRLQKVCPLPITMPPRAVKKFLLAVSGYRPSFPRNVTPLPKNSLGATDSCWTCSVMTTSPRSPKRLKDSSYPQRICDRISSGRSCLYDGPSSVPRSNCFQKRSFLTRLLFMANISPRSGRIVGSTIDTWSCSSRSPLGISILQC